MIKLSLLIFFTFFFFITFFSCIKFKTNLNLFWLCICLHFLFLFAHSSLLSLFHYYLNHLHYYLPSSCSSSSSPLTTFYWFFFTNKTYREDILSLIVCQPFLFSFFSLSLFQLDGFRTTDDLQSWPFPYLIHKINLTFCNCLHNNKKQQKEQQQT